MSEGNTFEAIVLDPDAWAQGDYSAFVKELREKLVSLTKSRSDWYRGQHRKTRWVNQARTIMVVLGSVAVLSTALAAGLRVYLAAQGSKEAYDIVLMGIALAFYAAMGAVSFFERSAEGTGHYFRSTMAILAIRDLWTAYQFKDTQMCLEQDPVGATEIVARKQKWLESAKQYCTALDAIATQEITEWRGAFQTAMTQLAGTAASGLAAAQTALSDAVKADAAAAKTAAEEARRAADTANAAAKPASLNLSIVNAPGGQAVVKLDGRIAAEGPDRSFAFTNLAQGEHRLRVEISAVAGGTAKAMEQVISLPPGITNLNVTPV